MLCRRVLFSVSLLVCVIAWWFLWPSNNALVSRLELRTLPLPMSEADSFTVFRTEDQLRTAAKDSPIPDLVKMHVDFERHDLARVCWTAPLTAVRSSSAPGHTVPYYPDLRACSTLGGQRIHFYLAEPPAKLTGTEMHSTFTRRWNEAWYAVPKNAHVQMASAALAWTEVNLVAAFVLLILLHLLGRRPVASLNR